MDQPSLPLVAMPNVRRGRGRPKGATGKRSVDLARYIEATFGGMTPGQQSAALCLVTPADLKEAKALAKELQVIDVDVDKVTLAMVIKAKKLARALATPGCSWPRNAPTSCPTSTRNSRRRRRRPRARPARRCSWFRKGARHKPLKSLTMMTTT